MNILYQESEHKKILKTLYWVISEDKKIHIKINKCFEKSSFNILDVYYFENYQIFLIVLELEKMKL